VGALVGCTDAGGRPATPVKTQPGVPTSPAEAFRARVERVVDGDTLIARVDGHPRRLRVRLIGIDAPETAKPDVPAECFGPEASAYAGGLVAGMRVRAAYQSGGRTDRFGRELWDIWLEDGRFVAGLLVEQGYATAHPIQPQVSHSGYLERLEGLARDGVRGLWGPPCHGGSAPVAAAPAAPSRPPATASPPQPSGPAYVEPVRTFASPAEVARDLTAATRLIQDRRTPTAQLIAAARTQQLAYRQLVVRSAWRDPAVAALPGDLRESARAIVAAGAALRELTSAQPRLPRWRIVPPAPADELLRYFREAERATGVNWSYLAAINFVETKMGRIRGTSTAGARGPMQFLPSTWAEVGGGGDIDDPRDSILAAARYLVRRGGGDIARGLRGYNNSALYVTAVRAYAREMRRDASTYRGFFHWLVTYRWTRGDVLLLEGYGGRRAG
jgi:endonuclease YncB( thermonuclease family)/soluble lytic murein transglycosylase-like protein